MKETSWLLLLRLLGSAAFIMALYSTFSGRVYGRSWKKYMGGWIYRKEEGGSYRSYVAMWYFIAITSFICTIVFLG